MQFKTVHNFIKVPRPSRHQLTQQPHPLRQASSGWKSAHLGKALLRTAAKRGARGANMCDGILRIGRGIAGNEVRSAASGMSSGVSKALSARRNCRISGHTLPADR